MEQITRPPPRAPGPDAALTSAPTQKGPAAAEPSRGALRHAGSAQPATFSNFATCASRIASGTSALSASSMFIE